VQAALQHTPSAQIPEPQSLTVPVHATPLGSLQVPAAPLTLHLNGAVHELVVQQTLSTQLRPALQSLGVCEGLHTAPAAPVETQ